MSNNGKNLEEKLREKLERGEITQEEFDNLYAKFNDLDLLSSKVEVKPKKKSYSFIGSRTHEGGSVDDIIRVSGKFISNDSLECKGMKISGSAEVRGDLKVQDGTSISGKIDVENDAIFEGPFKLSGKASVGGNIDFDDIVKISGKLETRNDIDAEGYMKVSGKVMAGSLISISTVKISGKVNVDNDLVADRFETSGGGSYIGGSLKAKTVEIARRLRERGKRWTTDELDDLEDLDEGEVEMFPEIAKFVTRIVTQVVPNIVQESLGAFSVPKTFHVGGNIEGETIDISYTEVKGDVIADTVIFGPDVSVDGTVYYKTIFDAPNPDDFDIIKISDSTEA